MSNFEIELNSNGIKQLLRSSEMMGVCKELAAGIQKKCGSGYEMDTYTGSGRVNASVFASDASAKKDNAKNNTILKALGR